MFTRYSLILSWSFNICYYLAPTHFSNLLHYLLIQTLWSSQTDVLIIPHKYYVHLNSPLVLLFIPILLPWMFFPFFSPHLSPASFLDDISQIWFLPKWNLSLQLQRCAGCSPTDTLATAHLIAKYEPLPFVSHKSLCHKPAPLYSQLPKLSSWRQVVH